MQKPKTRTELIQDLQSRLSALEKEVKVLRWVLYEYQRLEQKNKRRQPAIAQLIDAGLIRLEKGVRELVVKIIR